MQVFRLKQLVEINKPQTNLQSEGQNENFAASDELGTNPQNPDSQANQASSSLNIQGAQSESIFSQTTSQEYNNSYTQNRFRMNPMSASMQSLSLPEQSRSNESGLASQRGAHFRRSRMNRSNMVMIRNIDKDTTKLIISDIHDRDCLGLNYGYISENILLVKFRTQESAEWVINQFNDKEINGRVLSVSHFLETSQDSHDSKQRKHQFTQLAQIHEVYGDEDIDQESSMERSKRVSSNKVRAPPRKQSNHSNPRVASQSPITHQKVQPQISTYYNQPQAFSQPQQKIRSSMPINSENYNFTDHKFYQQNQPYNVTQKQYQRQLNFTDAQWDNSNVNFNAFPSALSIPTQQNVFQNSDIHQQQQQMYQYHSPQQVFHVQQQYIQYSQRSMTPKHMQYGHHTFQENKMPFSTTPHPYVFIPPNNPQHVQGGQSLNQSKIHQVLPPGFHTIQPHLQQQSDIRASPQFKQDESQYKLNQKMQELKLSGQLNKSDSIHTFGKNSNEQHISFEEDIANQANFMNQEHHQGSEGGGSFNANNPSNVKVILTNSTKSDSNLSQTLKACLPQQYQSPIQKVQSMSHIGTTGMGLNDHSFDFGRANSYSGLDTPPLYFQTPAKQLNSSFQFQNQGSLHIPSQGSGMHSIGHNRNFSHDQFIQFNEPQAYGRQQFYQSQQIMMNGFPQYSNSMADLMMSNTSLYGVPLQPHYPPLMQNSSNSSMEGMNSSFSSQNRKKKSNRDLFKSHQTLKHNYQEPSVCSQDSVNELDIEKIKNGEDQRTTLMIKNIPNKYNQLLLLKEINTKQQGKYDFLYLPIDFVNQANVGYAFVNFIHPLFILDFFFEFQNRKWSKFNSIKKCDIKYGRIQGLEQLENHFRTSSVMNQNDESLRPRIFLHNRQKDLSIELKKIVDKYGIKTPLSKFNTAHSTSQSQSSFPQIEHAENNEEESKTVSEENKKKWQHSTI